MRIANFCAKYPYPKTCSSIRNENYSCGGSILTAYNLSSNLAKIGVKVYVFTTSFDAHDAVEEYTNIKITRFATNYKLLSANISFGMFLRPISYDTDIVHVHFDIPPAPLAGLYYAKRKKKPLILTYHGDWPANYGNVFRRGSLYITNKYFVNKILSSASKIISPSEHYINASLFLKNYKDKIVTIPNGIDIGEFDILYTKEQCRLMLNIPVYNRVLLFCGYLSPHKGPDILLRAFSQIKRYYQDIKLIFMGDGLMLNYLQAMAKVLGIEKDVIFVGNINGIRKTMYYKSADIFCLPSVMESFGIVNLEAMACSIPIIASNTGGIPDIVKQGYNGILVEPRNDVAMANAIARLLDDENLAKKMGERGNKLVKEYTWEKIAERTYKVYNEVLQ